MAMDKVEMGALIRAKLRAVDVPEIPEKGDPNWENYHIACWEAISEGIIQHLTESAELRDAACPTGSVTGGVI
jgi:hypothetical protein